MLVVDGLDEAGTRDRENVLGLPNHLPAGAFILASTQPVPIALDVQPPPVWVRLEADDIRNEQDARRYLHAAVAADPLAGALPRWAFTDGPEVLIERARRSTH